MNNDGFGDAVVSSYGYQKDMVKFTGKFDIFFGTATGVNLDVAPDFTAIGDTVINLPGFVDFATGSKFGYSLDCAGDVDNDGVQDLIVGAPSISMIDTTGGGSDTISTIGGFYIYYGENDMADFGTRIDTFYGNQAISNLGLVVAGVQDVTGDLIDDIIVSAPSYRPNVGDNFVGAVFIYEGSASGLNPIPVDTIYGTTQSEFFGSALSGVGDLNGDGVNEILIGAHNYIMGTDTAIGRVQMYLGGGDFASPDWQKTGQHKREQFGFSIADAKNFDATTTGSEILIGSNNFNPKFMQLLSQVNQNGDPIGIGRGIGAVYIYSGNGAGLSDNLTTQILNDVGVSGFGSSVSSAGDVDGDGVSDIIVGAPFYSLGGANQGATYGYYGSNFEAVKDTTFDWCVVGEKNNAFLGASIDLIGGQINDGPIGSVISGAYGYGSADTLFQGAAFLYKGSSCGLIKYEQPVFLSFPPDTIFVIAEKDTCGAHVPFEYPEVGSNCEDPMLTILTGIDSSGFFPIGENTVTFQIQSNGQTRDSSFVILVEDTQPPMPTTCPMTVDIQLDPDMDMAAIVFDLPIFEDNENKCTGLPLSPIRESGLMPGTMKGVGVYPYVYSATDASGNISYCSFRVVIRKTDTEGKQCDLQEINEEVSIDGTTLASGNFEFPYLFSSKESLSGGNFGIKLILALFEGISGISLPGWVKEALGESAGTVDLAFVKITLNFLPVVEITAGAYYKLVEDVPQMDTIDYIGEVCSFKPPDTFFGCRDTINFSSSFLVDPSSSNLIVNPGGLKQVFGIFAEDLTFKWPISITVKACIGIPLCIPFVGCAGCLGYEDSWETPEFQVFDPIVLLDPRVELDLVSVCDDIYSPNAGLDEAIECLTGFNPGFINTLSSLYPGGFDPFSYNEEKDEVRFDFNSLPVIGNEIPEMDLTFGRLTSDEMGPTFVKGSALTTTGMENRFFIARLDIFSFVAYAIPEQAKQTLSCVGISIGTNTIDIGLPTVGGVDQMGNDICSVEAQNTLLRIDMLDINVSLRSALKVEYEFDPEIKVEEMKFTDSDNNGLEVYWERPNAMPAAMPGFGTDSIITGVAMDENITIVVPDGIVDPFFVNNQFSADGKFTGRDFKTENLDFDINILEFLPTSIIPNGFGPLLSIPIASFPISGQKNIRVYNEDINIPGFSAKISMVPDNIPPLTVSRDTVLVLDQFGNAYLGDPALYVDASSMDLPVGGTGTVIPVDVFPDTLYCTDYPGIFASLVTRDDNCNFDTIPFYVELLDLTPPQLGCVDITVGIGENGTYVMNPDEVIIGAVDNCNDIIPTVTPNIFTCADVGTPVEVMIVVEDIAGNVDSCTVTVTVIDTFLLQLECPFLLAYPVTRSTSDIACTYTPDNDEFKPTLVAPDCNTMITWELIGATVGSGMSNVGGTPFNLGETIVTYTATDASDNTTSCSFIVIVEDTVLPIINCPPTVDISTNEDGANDYNCTTDYSWNHPNPTDNCSVIAYEIQYTNPDGSTETEDLKALYDASTLSVTRNFGLGITDIKYTVVDTMNNIVMCNFSVTVIDDEAPMIFCEQVTATNVFALNANVNIEPNDVTTATINVPVSMSITNMYMIELVGTQPDMGDVSFTLTSPQGTTINLFNGLCAGSADFDAPLNDSGVGSITTASCGPLGGGVQLMPIDPFSTFNGEDSEGD